MIWIKARLGGTGQHQADRMVRTRGCGMQDMLGSAGMLRGWIAVWSMDMVWFVATMTLTVGATATLELLFGGHARRVLATLPPQAAVSEAGDRESPLV